MMDDNNLFDVQNLAIQNYKSRSDIDKIERERVGVEDHNPETIPNNNGHPSIPINDNISITTTTSSSSSSAEPITTTAAKDAPSSSSAISVTTTTATIPSSSQQPISSEKVNITEPIQSHKKILNALFPNRNDQPKGNNNYKKGQGGDKRLGYIVFIVFLMMTIIAMSVYIYILWKKMKKLEEEKLQMTKVQQKHQDDLNNMKMNTRILDTTYNDNLNKHLQTIHKLNNEKIEGLYKCSNCENEAEDNMIYLKINLLKDSMTEHDAVTAVTAASSNNNNQHPPMKLEGMFIQKDSIQKFYGSLFDFGKLKIKFNDENKTISNGTWNGNNKIKIEDPNEPMFDFSFEKMNHQDLLNVKK
jgi:hypothetical protein